MKRIIDKVLRKENEGKLCPVCDTQNPLNKEKCMDCGFEFNTANRSTPEKGL